MPRRFTAITLVCHQEPTLDKSTRHARGISKWRAFAPPGRQRLQLPRIVLTDTVTILGNDLTTRKSREHGIRGDQRRHRVGVPGVGSVNEPLHDGFGQCIRGRRRVPAVCALRFKAASFFGVITLPPLRPSATACGFFRLAIYAAWYSRTLTDTRSACARSNATWSCSVTPAPM